MLPERKLLNEAFKNKFTYLKIIHFFIVGTVELQRLMQSINRVNDVISERIEHFNFGKSDNLVNQELVFNQEFKSA